jgi:quercetin dioxygenase-like cupin family protein
MKKSRINILALSIALIMLLASCGDKAQQKPDQTAEKSTDKAPTVIFENAYAEVVKVTLAPGEQQPVHDGANRVIYALTDYVIDWEEEGQKTGEKTWKKGDVHFHEAGTHAAKNTGTTTAEWLIFAKKEAELPDCEDNTLEKDVTTVAAEMASVLIDKDSFKITSVALPKGASIPMHSGVNRIIYALTDYQLAYESNTEGKSEKQFKAGDVHWHEACMHALENTGDSDAEFLVVSYK